ncbi:MAG: hypothetical protein JM58_11135 [Peptococcaceae bacterium BICA1-8]|nr:MAG: hypothetical protein JM58_11135 [Peptococcaceae bacterium BICA1-8]
MASGIIFNIQRYSIHDGPGIRTTVFLKGCPLNCWWCHNPESQNIHQEIVFWPDRCLNCGDCLKACAKKALTIRNDAFFTDKSKCELCASCVKACFTEARELIGKQISTEEAMEEIKKDIIFYDQSGGGVTFSGGEPLMQGRFLQELLLACQKEYIHTTVDTSGYAPWEVLKGISKLTNLFLYDIKLIDERKHIKFTGVSNRLVLDNLQRLTEEKMKIIIRVPIIPHINDDADNILQTGRLMQSLGLKEINLLPYHGTAASKYERRAETYPLKNQGTPSEDKMQDISSLLTDLGLNVKVGG